MRICLLANARSVHTRRWALAYAERGHRVDVLGIRRARIPGVAVHALPVGPVNSSAAGWSLASYLRLLAAARGRLRRLRPDVLHAHFTVTHGAIAAWARFHPRVVTAWGSDVLAPGRGATALVRRSLNRLALRRADLVTATSAFLAERTLDLAPPGGAVLHLPWGVDLERFRPPEGGRRRWAEGDGPRIGFVKTLDRRYGPQHLVAALPRVLERLPGARLVLAGRGPLDDELRRQAERLGVASRLELAGFVPHDEVPELLAGLDLLVNPTVVDESFGVAVLEASAAALPVVATRVGGVAEVAVDGETALLVEPGDPAALAEAIVRLGTDQELARRLGRRGRRFVEERYRWSDTVDRMLAELGRLAAGGAG